MPALRKWRCLRSSADSTWVSVEIEVSRSERMRDREPEPAEEESSGVFEVEIGPLGAEDADQQAPGLSVLPARPLSRRARAWRVAAVGSALLAFVLVLRSEERRVGK